MSGIMIIIASNSYIFVGDCHASPMSEEVFNNTILWLLEDTLARNN